MRNIHSVYFILLLLTVSFTAVAQNQSASLNDDGTKKVTRTVQPVKAAPSKTVTKPKNTDTSLPYYNYKGIQNLDMAKTEWLKDHPLNDAAKVQPYTNYKGIANAEQAKKEWIKDNPEAYKKMQTGSSVSKVVTKQPVNTDPNKNRRLPKNYNDSKTNVNSKN